MYRYRIRTVDNKSGNPMLCHSIGLTLSFSFLG